MRYTKAWALLLAAAMIFSVLTACGAQKMTDTPEALDISGCTWETEPGSDKYAGRTLRILQTAGGAGNYFEPIVERMKEFYPGLEIEYVYAQYAEDMLRTQILDGDMPDIFTVNSGLLPIYDLIQQGFCAPVDGIFEVSTLDGAAKLGDLLDMETFFNGEMNGVHYAMNDIFYITGLWYDANFFEANGLSVPFDWESLQQLAVDCDALGMDVLGACGLMSSEYATNYWWWPMVASTDYELYCRLNNLDYRAWRSDEMKQVVEKMVWLRDNGYYNTDTISLSNAQTQMSFITHSFALLPCGSWLETEMADAWTKDWQLSFLPYSFGDTADDAYYAVNTLVSMVSADTENMDLVCEFYRFLYSDPESIADSAAIHANIVQLPGFEETYGDLIVPSVRNATTTIESMKSLNLEATYWYPALNPELGDMIVELMSGELTAEAFIRRGYDLFRSVAGDDTVAKYDFTG